jgi:beta-lactamase regulating signal transducer with metallopeptidase domain
VGFLRPILIVSDTLSKLLPPQQMSLAVEHERAHVRSWDNLKRLLLVFAPDLLPFTRSMRSLERNWAALAEWAADDHAVDGDARKALTLAETLVQVAKLGGEVQQNAHLSSLFALHSLDFRRRVDRLIERSAGTGKKLRLPREIPAAGMAAFIAAIATAGCNLYVLRIAHTWLERLIH